MQSILSPEDFEKYKGSFGPSPPREEVPLALQLAKREKQGAVFWRRLSKSATTFVTFKPSSRSILKCLLSPRSASTRFNERLKTSRRLRPQLSRRKVLLRISGLGAPGLPQAQRHQGLLRCFLHPLLLLRKFPHEEDDDEEMERKMVLLLLLVLELAPPSRPNGRKAQALSMRDLARLQRDWSSCPMLGRKGRKNQWLNELSAPTVGVRFFDAKARETKTFFTSCCAGPNTGKVTAQSPAVRSPSPVRSFMHPFSGHRVFQGTASQTGEQCFDDHSSGANVVSSGAPLLRASGAQHSVRSAVCAGGDSLAEGDDIVSGGDGVAASIVGFWRWRRLCWLPCWRQAVLSLPSRCVPSADRGEGGRGQEAGGAGG